MTEKQYDRVVGITGIVVIVGLFIGVAVLRRNRFDDRYGKARQEYRDKYAAWEAEKQIATDKFLATHDNYSDYFVWDKEYNRSNRFNHPFPKRRDYK